MTKDLQLMRSSPLGGKTFFDIFKANIFRNADMEVLQKLLDYMNDQAAAMEDYIMEREPTF